MTDPVNNNLLIPGTPIMTARSVRAVDSARRGFEGRDNGAMEKACKEFESLFVQHMLKQMRETVPKDGLFSGGSAERVYTSMLDGEMAKTISDSKGIGLAPILYRQLAAMNESEKKSEQIPKVPVRDADNQNK